MPKTISPDSTVATVWPHLVNQREYVSGLLYKMRQCRAAHGNSFVKLGVTGTGQRPYYRVFYVAPGCNDDAIFGSFYDNHDELENGFVETKNWSSSSMSFDEVQDFYAHAIGYNGKKY
jgi:hypothetical protein